MCPAVQFDEIFEMVEPQLTGPRHGGARIKPGHPPKLTAKSRFFLVLCRMHTNTEVPVLGREENGCAAERGDKARQELHQGCTSQIEIGKPNPETKKKNTL